MLMIVILCYLLQMLPLKRVVRCTEFCYTGQTKLSCNVQKCVLQCVRNCSCVDFTNNNTDASDIAWVERQYT